MSDTMAISPEKNLKIDLLIASIYYLMTRYARMPDLNVSRAICQHLEMLSTHPNCDSEILQNAGKRLASQWNGYLGHNIQEENQAIRVFSALPEKIFH